MTRTSIPRDKSNDYTNEAMQARRDFVTTETKTDTPNIAASTIPPADLAGNIENAIGVAQVPVGIAGPLLVDGEHMTGECYVPLATTEGTLVASYNRGMRLLSECGGAKVTILERQMQRAPVFHFASARDAKTFRAWLEDHFADVAAACETTTSVGKLLRIESYGVGPMIYTRFNFFTGDAAGQNMSGKAAQAGCKWIMANYGGPIRGYTLSGAIDTDKKYSLLNSINSRGARVVAEVILPPDVVERRMHLTTRQLYHGRSVANTGHRIAGTSGNGVHGANALAALFIATGQDAANVAESHATLTHLELREDGSLYWSTTLPSLIVATYGGGTGLPTQRECLEMMDCYGSGKVMRFIEICAATVLAGELSLASAVVAGDWVESHDNLGRNRP